MEGNLKKHKTHRFLQRLLSPPLYEETLENKNIKRIYVHTAPTTGNTVHTI